LNLLLSYMALQFLFFLNLDNPILLFVSLGSDVQLYTFSFSVTVLVVCLQKMHKIVATSLELHTTISLSSIANTYFHLCMK
jgi:hypothetical protein